MHIPLLNQQAWAAFGPSLLKMVPIVLSSSLTFIINKRNTSGIFRIVWKHVKVKPLFKSRTKNELNNYRPISILPTLSKIIEKWTHMRLMSFLKQHPFLNQKQSRLRAAHST